MIMTDLIDLWFSIKQILGTTEYDIFRRYYQYGEKQREIARVYNVSQQTISRRLKKIREKIKNKV